MSKFTPLKTGIEIIEGRPGSGKSYFAVDRLVRAIAHLRRPVYTNLPLKGRVISQLLRRRGGRGMMRYIIPLTRDHFLEFLARFEALSAAREEAVSMGRSPMEGEEAFLAATGPHVSVPTYDVLYGDGISVRVVARDVHEARAAAESDRPGVEPTGFSVVPMNWIEYGAVLALDELHKWLPQEEQRHAPWVKSLIAWATMHRHAMHWVWVMTQNRMQVPIHLRRQCIEYVRCVDKSRLPFLFGLRLPLPAFFYEVYPAEMLDESATNFESVKPISAFIRIPWFSGGLIWRLYDSFTHVGGSRQLEKRMEATRERVEQADYDRNYEKKVRAAMKRKRRLIWGFAKLCLVALAVWLAYEIGQVSVVAPALADPPADPVSRFARPPRSETVPLDPPDIPQAVTPRPGSPLLDRMRGQQARHPTETSNVGLSGELVMGAMGDGFVVISGRVVSIGERVNDLVLLETSPVQGISSWMSDYHGPLLWRLGATPMRLPVGPIRDREEAGATTQPVAGDDGSDDGTDSGAAGE